MSDHPASSGQTTPLWGRCAFNGLRPAGSSPRRSLMRIRVRRITGNPAVTPPPRGRELLAAPSDLPLGERPELHGLAAAHQRVQQPTQFEQPGRAGQHELAWPRHLIDQRPSVLVPAGPRRWPAGPGGSQSARGSWRAASSSFRGSRRRSRPSDRPRSTSRTGRLPRLPPRRPPRPGCRPGLLSCRPGVTRDQCGHRASGPQACRICRMVGAEFAEELVQDLPQG